MSKQLALSAMLSIFAMAAFAMSGDMLSQGKNGAQAISLGNDMSASYGDMMRVPEIPFPGLQ